MNKLAVVSLWPKNVITQILQSLYNFISTLASRCVYLSRAKGTEQDAAWDWLAENSTNNTHASTSVDAAWYLLKGMNWL